MRGKLLGTIALRQREVMSSRNAAGRGILSPISGGAFGLRQCGYADMAQKKPSGKNPGNHASDNRKKDRKKVKRRNRENRKQQKEQSKNNKKERSKSHCVRGLKS